MDTPEKIKKLKKAVLALIDIHDVIKEDGNNILIFYNNCHIRKLDNLINKLKAGHERCND